MKREARPVLMGEQREAVAEALLAQQVATHRANTRYAVGGSGITALLLMAMEWRAVPATVLLAWLGGVVMVLGLRLIVGVAHRRAAPDPTSNRAWLRRYRVGFLAHGIIWGLASVMPLPSGDGLHLAILIVVLVSMTASNFTLTAFDLPSALFFGVPVLGLLSARLVAQGDATYWLLGAAAMVVLVFLSLTARRAQQVVRSYVALRLVEAAQAQALRSSEEFLERTGATAGVGGWVLDPMTMSLRLTAQACRIHDFEAMARPGFETFLQRYDPSEHARIRLAVDAVVAHGTPFDLELPLATADGQQRWVRLIGEAQLESGKAVRVSGVVQDITQAKITALALAEKHHLLTLLVRTTSQGYWFVDADGVTTDVNPAMCEILRCAREDIIGQRIFAFVDAANAAIFCEQMAHRDRGVLGSYEVTLTRPDGTRVDCFNNATPIFDTGGRRIGSVGMWTNISERKQAEQRLRATSELLIQKTQALQVTLDSITQGIVSTDAAGHFTVYNRRLLEMLDLPESIVAPGKTIDDSLAFQTERGDFGAGLRFIDPVTRRFVAASDHQSVPEHYVRETPSGGHLEVRTRRLPDGGMVRTLTDVTAYFEAQQALHDSEAELRALLDALPGYIVVLDSNFAYTYVNEQFTTLIGTSRDDIVGRPVREILGEARSARIREHASRVRPGLPVTIESEYEATADRPKIWLQVTYAVGADAGTGHHKFYAFGIDISARKAAEEALIAAKDEAERANRAKSQFLSSMSHELRTPMNAILGFGQLLVSDPVDPLADRQRGHVQEILRGARHLLKLINEVLDLALVETGKLQVFLEPVPLAKLLQECLGLLRPLIRNDAIDVSVVDEAPCDCVVVADRTRLKQVLLNLLSRSSTTAQGGRFASHARLAATRCASASATTGPA